MRLLAVLSLLALAVSSHPSAQQRPDFSGAWTAVKDAPTGVQAAPTPVFAARLWLRQQGDRLTVIRPVRDTAVVADHPLDGSDVRSRVPGATCLGDPHVITSVAWQGNTIVHRTVGSIPPGGGTVIPSSVRHTLRLENPETLVVEGLMRVPGQTEPVTVGTVYKRMTDPPPAPPAVVDVKAAPATLGQIGWLAGTWVATAGTATIEERWTPASGGSMLATSRTVRKAAVFAFEFLCVAERQGSLVYTAMPNGRTPATDFMLTTIDETSATFENPSHDFPKAIRYALRPDGTLEAAISGAAGRQTTTFVFKKQQ